MGTEAISNRRPGLGGGGGAARERGGQSMGLAWEEAIGTTERGGRSLGGGHRSHRGRWPERGPGLGGGHRSHRGRRPEQRPALQDARSHGSPTPALRSPLTLTLSGTHHTAQHSWQLGQPSLRKDSDPC